MLKYDDHSALKIIRSYLDKMDFAYMSYRIIPEHDTKIFPEFSSLHSTLKHVFPIYRLLLTVFREGHAADEEVLRQALPTEVMEAMISTGLLVQNARKRWSTPSLAIVPIEGIYLLVSLPPTYPTAGTRKQPIYLGPESIWLTKALPATLAGQRVLDICAGSGIQGLVCAARGAAQVVGLEKSEEAVAVARFNAGLNGFSDVVEIRESDLFSALADNEVFDFVVSNPPFMPVMEDVEYPLCGAGGADGARILRRIFEGLGQHLSANAQGVLFCNALGDQFSININRDLLSKMAKDERLDFCAFVNTKSPIADYIKFTLDGNLKNTCPELSSRDRAQKIAAWQESLRQQQVPASFLYGQIIRFWKGRAETGITHMPAYNPLNTDPLVVRTMQAKIMA
jgi:methylase of polypeptide subunit release factors